MINSSLNFGVYHAIKLLAYGIYVVGPNGASEKDFFS
jgi:hypothetical protein